MFPNYSINDKKCLMIETAGKPFFSIPFYSTFAFCGEFTEKIFEIFSKESAINVLCDVRYLHLSSFVSAKVLDVCGHHGKIN